MDPITVTVEINAVTPDVVVIPPPPIDVVVTPPAPVVVEIAAVPGLPTGSAGTFVYYQTTPSDAWTITHNLGRLPCYEVLTSAGDVIEGGLEFVDMNTVRLHFSGALSGTAFLT